MQVSILGAGRWGSLLAWAQHQQKRPVVLWNRPDEFLLAWQKTRRNKYLRLPQTVLITSDLKRALESKVIFISVWAQHFDSLCRLIKKNRPKNKLFILAMKGLEQKTGQRLSQILKKHLGGMNQVGMLAGPGHPQEISRFVPTAMTVATERPADLARAVRYCQTDLIKIFPNADFIGVEVGAALKNVMGIAAGILVGLKKPSFKSYLLARGPIEVGRLIKKLGGLPETAFGLSFLGDFGATVFSSFSHNHQAGELWVKSRQLAKNAEGLPTLKAVNLLIRKYKIDMPICQAVYQIVYKKKNPESLITSLLSRPSEEDY